MLSRIDALEALRRAQEREDTIAAEPPDNATRARAIDKVLERSGLDLTSTNVVYALAERVERAAPEILRRGSGGPRTVALCCTYTVGLLEGLAFGLLLADEVAAVPAPEGAA